MQNYHHRMRSNKKFCFAEGTPKAGGQNPANVVDQAEKGGDEPSERDNLKNGV